MDFGRDAAPESAREVRLYVSVDEVFPDTKGTLRELVQVLATLSRDDALFQCARTNTIVSGFGDFEDVPRQQQPLDMLCNQEQIDRSNDFANRHRATEPPFIFFRGQLLELMRWAAVYFNNLPGDGTTYLDAAFRARFVKAALIASGLWATRTFRDALSGAGDADQIRPRAMRALRKGVEEANLSPRIGIAIRRGLKLFTEYLPKRAPDFAERFLRKTGLTSRQYPGCASALLVFTLRRSNDGPLFSMHKLAAPTSVASVDVVEIAV